MPKEIKQIKDSQADFIEWFSCPHCGKTIMRGSQDFVKALEKWAKQRSLKIKKKCPKKK